MSQVTTKSIQDSSVTEPKLADSGATAGTYVGALSVTVSAKGRVTAMSSLAPIIVSATAQATINTSTATLMPAMSVTPPAGTYLVQFSADMDSSGNNPAGTIAIYKNTTRSNHTLRQLRISVFALVLGAGNAALGANHSQDVITCNGTDTIWVEWLATSGTLIVNGRSLILTRVG